jgi:hypothetical protein
MAWIYLAESADSPLPSRPGCVLSPTVKVTDTLSLSCFPGWQAVICLMPQSGTTCELCHQRRFLSSTSSTADSLARTSALQELEKAWAEVDRDYSSKLSASLANFDPDSSSWKTSQLSLFEDSTRFSWNSLRWGSIVDGRLYQPQKWAPRTFAKDSGFLPTPAASEYGSSNNGTRDGVTEYRLKGKPSLSTMARRIPTPWASDGEKGGPNQNLHGEPSLAALAVRMPTPCSRDGKDGLTPNRHGRHSPSVAVAVAVAESGHRGYLNPRFVEVMMGYPIGWTALEDWATQWLLKVRGKRSCDSPVSQEVL